MIEKVVWAGESPELYSRKDVGGKGLYLLGLHNTAQKTSLFEVPKFFIVPDGEYSRGGYQISTRGDKFVFEGNAVREAFETLKKPVAVRSSSELEDGIHASFAGIFESRLDQKSYDDLESAAFSVLNSRHADHVERYANRRGIDARGNMALIIQEQVVDFNDKGTIQLEPDQIIMQGKNSTDTWDHGFIDELKSEKQFDNYQGPKWEKWGRLGEIDFYYAIHAAREAARHMNLDGVVQVEYLLRAGNKPAFVQIRKLPNIPSHAEQLDLDVPKGATYMESEVCNGVAGELVLPAYVTLSQAGFRPTMIECGLGHELGFGQEDSRAEEFYKKSRLPQNEDYRHFRKIEGGRRFNVLDDSETIRYYNHAWKRGNSLFDSYILVCDKLDQSFVGMDRLTTGKKAIITCGENDRTSHAMTVARESGMIGMGTRSDMSDVNNFFHQIETGDLVHVKSDGKQAVAYVEKKRESDPYKNNGK